MRVICTAGHVDHGKSTLVTALTGRDPDRLAEEKRRGLTIDLGFAWTTLPDVGDVAFVDLPGHERFVPTMLAGAGPVRTALFVVAADEGWMPQSAEHLAILELLGTTHAVVALTRVDLVDEETAWLAAELLADQLQDTALADAPIVPVSSTTGAGLEELRVALGAMLSAAPAVPDDGRPRMWLDRAFSIRGAGTVVTGTLQGGAVAVGDRLHVLPLDREVRVRGLQSLEQDVAEVRPGWRVAMNLSGIDADEVGRGDAVVGGGWRTTEVLEALVTPVDGQVVGRRGAWTAHVGTAAVGVHVHPVAGQDLLEVGAVRLEMDRPLPLAVGDRVVLRESGRGVTAGGGTVIDPAPGPRVRGATARRSRAQRLERAGSVDAPANRVRLLVEARRAAPTAAVLADANAGPDAIAAGDAVVVGDHLVHPEEFALWSGLAVSAVVSFHQRRPALPAVDPEVPRRRLREADCPHDVIRPLLGLLVERDRLTSVPGGVAAPGHEPRLTVAQQSARVALLERLDAEGASPAPLAEVAEAVGADDDLLTVLRSTGQLVDLPGLDAAMTASALERATARLAALQADSGPFTASQAREALDTTRRFALPLLELLDTTGVTTRDGDLRHLT